MEASKSDEPTSDMTRIGAVMLDALKTHPEYTEDMKCMVLIDSGNDGGIAAHGYDDSAQMIVDLFTHLRALSKAHGKNCELIMIPDAPEGLES